MVSLHKQERENRSSSQVLQQPWKALHVCPPLQHQFQNQSRCSLSPVLRLDLAREQGCPHRASLVTLFPFPLPCLCLLGCPKSLSASRVPEPPKSTHTEQRWGTKAPFATTGFSCLCSCLGGTATTALIISSHWWVPDLALSPQTLSFAPALASGNSLNYTFFLSSTPATAPGAGGREGRAKRRNQRGEVK